MSEATRSERERDVRRWRPVLLGSALLAAALVPGCGGGSSPSQPSTPARTVVLQGGWALGPDEFARFEGPIGVSVTLDATVEWTLATNDVDVYITTSLCTDEQFANVQCSFLASATSATTKPERASVGVTAGTCRIWVVNFGPEKESGTVEVGVTE